MGRLPGAAGRRHAAGALGGRDRRGAGGRLPHRLRRRDGAAAGVRPGAVRRLARASGPDAYRAASPLTYVDRVRAPVLVLAGENDPRCPIRQVDNYLDALAARGDVPLRGEPLRRRPRLAWWSPRPSATWRPRSTSPRGHAMAAHASRLCCAHGDRRRGHVTSAAGSNVPETSAAGQRLGRPSPEERWELARGAVARARRAGGPPGPARRAGHRGRRTPAATSSPCTWSASRPTTARSPTSCWSRCRSTVDPTALVDAVEAAGIPCTLLVRADATELSDPATTALALARMVAADPGSAPRAVATLLRARLVDPAGPSAGHTSTRCASAPSSCGWAAAWPFTATELSRAAALLELAAQLAMRAPVRAAGGRPDRCCCATAPRCGCARPSRRDAPLVAALHARCSPESRRSRFLSPTPQLPPAELAELLGASDRAVALHAVLAVTADGGSAVGMANLDPDRTAGRGPVRGAGRGRLAGPRAGHRAAAPDRRRGRRAGRRRAGRARPARTTLGVTRLLRRAGLRPSAEIVDGEVRLRAACPLPSADAPAAPGPAGPGGPRCVPACSIRCVDALAGVAGEHVQVALRAGPGAARRPWPAGCGRRPAR